MTLTNDDLMYSEVYSFLNIIGAKYINKLPKKLFEFIKNQSKEQVKFDMHKDISLQMTEASIAFIAYLNLQYWVDNEEKKRLINLYNQNDIDDEIRKRKEYNVDNLFVNRSQSINTNLQEKQENINQNDKIAVINKVPWYKAIINKIQKLLKFKNS